MFCSVLFVRLAISDSELAIGQYGTVMGSGTRPIIIIISFIVATALQPGRHKEPGRLIGSRL
jgi:hypothetical protein